MSCVEAPVWLTLHCHPATPCCVVDKLQVALQPTTGGDLRLQYWLTADLGQIRLPEPCTPAFTDGLWEHTCFEAFLGVKGDSHYHEFNFSPSGQWAAYAFSRYRESVAWQVPRAPEINCGNDFVLETVLHSDNFPPNPAHKTLTLGLTAVIETITGEKSYWALQHPTTRPDFHHRNGFIHEIWP